MATLAELARDHTALGPDELGHLQRLVATWGVLADLCFSDLLLLAPVATGGGFVVVGQVRPTTAQTLHPDDLVGRVVGESERPLVPRALRRGEIVEGEIAVAGRAERARTQCIPVRCDGKVIAVLTRESTPTVGRRPGQLERVYVQTFERLARMIVHGDFPFHRGDIPSEEGPRVGDGVILLDASRRLEFASPNAMNALHRMGITANVEGLTLEELGVEEAEVRAAFSSRSPATQESVRFPDVTVLLRVIPLLDKGEVTGALLLTRDVTELRRRERLLLSKDATIREVHHRVKNNLQTISSILRLQARRSDSDQARDALDEAARRIRSIGLVHEILSREPSEQVAFADIVGPLVRMAEEGVLSPERPVRFEVSGDAGELPAEVATPLAVVITELLQNAVEHAFPDGGAGGNSVRVALGLEGADLVVEVRDNGRGLPDGFAIENTETLGLSIVRDLVTTQLGGTISMHTEDGTVVRLRVPASGVEVRPPASGRA